MQHFLNINQLSVSDIEALVMRASFFKQQKNYPQYSEHSAATLFYENSTRTRMSFEVAAKKLAMPLFNLDVQHSSETKGESLEDTLANLASMGIHCFVIRHSEDCILEGVAQHLGSNVSLMNAGDGQHEHPSQALLDLMTIWENKPALDKLKIVIVGDVRHSRVANSLQSLFKLVGVRELVFVAPSIWQPRTLNFGRWTDSMREGLENADVVIGLRVQKERLETDVYLDLEKYHEQYGIRQEMLKFAKNDLMIMHPGPVNRGIEMDNSVVSHPRSFILQQVTNGVFMRMALFERLILCKNKRLHVIKK